MSDLIKTDKGTFGKGNKFSTKAYKMEVAERRRLRELEGLYEEAIEYKMMKQIRESLLNQPEEVQMRVSSEAGMRPKTKLIKRIDEVTNRIIDESAYLHDIDWESRSDRSLRKDLISNLNGLQVLLTRLVSMASVYEDSMNPKDKKKLDSAKVALLDEARKRLQQK